MAHKKTTSHLARDSMKDYISKSLNMYWTGIKDDWDKYAKTILSCQKSRPNPRKRKQFKYIVCSKPLERYQIDCVELDHYLTQGTKFYGLLWVIDHFSKYGWAYLIKDKQTTTIRNKLSQALIQGIPKNIQSDNGSEFKNKVIDNYWRAHNINKIYGAPYKPRSQGAVEGFNKTIERGLRKAYYNLKDDGKEFDVEYELNLFLYFYNWNIAHSTTKLIPRDVFYGKEESGIWKDCQINTKKMHRNKVMDVPFNEGEEVLLSKWIYEQKPKKR